MGKTSLVKLVQESAKKVANRVVGAPRSLLSRIVAALGLHIPAEHRAGTQALRRYLLQQSKNGQIVAILIDDADELGPA